MCGGNRTTTKVKDTLIENEVAHGKYIAEHGEEVWHWSSPAGRLRWQRRVEMFKEFLGEDNKRVLEIGCGTGLFTEAISVTKNEIIAIDLSPILLDLARQRVSKQNTIFKVEDAHSTTFVDESFDFIIGSSTLHHLVVDLALKEFWRLLKVGGGLMFTEPNMLNPQIALERNMPFIRKLAHNSPDETAFFRWSLADKLKASGFKSISIQPFDFMHPAIPRPLLSVMDPILMGMESVPLIREIAGSLIIKATKG
ncbi:MAG: Methyltransferase type 12 [Candidatus Daviesbacteria bacterium GW2011_GWB1_41_5]|uniref:Methyltransferase type 12 n=1 Tax=Candidatus Daviesbacteria bacterium GW2011_GWB1_41_5 TaxID=1618429 RepID=A0A0G0WI05_9BACT|nr:MAG: Methyltransferase type 12 [Candidatus Daviesbacteria bacterium GW2011_GWB1_41_5]